MAPPERVQNAIELEQFVAIRPELEMYTRYFDFKVLKEYIKHRTLEKRTFRERVIELLKLKYEDD